MEISLRVGSRIGELLQRRGALVHDGRESDTVCQPLLDEFGVILRVRPHFPGKA